MNYCVNGNYATRANYHLSIGLMTIIGIQKCGRNGTSRLNDRWKWRERATQAMAIHDDSLGMAGDIGVRPQVRPAAVLKGGSAVSGGLSVILFQRRMSANLFVLLLRGHWIFLK